MITRKGQKAGYGTRVWGVVESLRKGAEFQFHKLEASAGAGGGAAAGRC